MSKSVPLGRCLSVKGENIVIGSLWGDVMDFLLKGNSTMQWRLKFIQRPISGNSDAVYNLSRGGHGRLGGEQVQHAQLILFPE